MTQYIRDPFQVKRLERLAKRRLTEAELNGDEPVRFKDADGKVVREWLKRYNIRDFFSR